MIITHRRRLIIKVARLRIFIREFQKGMEIRELKGDSYYTELDDRVKEMVLKSCKRALLNGRKTLMRQDL